MSYNKDNSPSRGATMVTTQQTEEKAEDHDSTETVEEHTEACPECGGQLKDDPEHGETSCQECGLIVESGEIDHGPDWRAHTQKERDEKSHVGAPTTKTMHDKGLSSRIGWQNKDAYGNTLSSRKRQQMQRLRTWDERFRTRDSKDRNLKQALGEIDRMGSALGLPDSARETASVIYRRALEENLLPGRSIEGVATATVYAAARQGGAPRSLDEVNNVSRIDRGELMRTYRYINQELNLAISPADPTNYLPRFISDLDVSPEVEQQARELLSIAKQEGITSGKNPVGLAAAAIYAGSLLCNEKVPQNTIGDVANVTEVTIRNRYKELLEAKGDTSNYA